MRSLALDDLGLTEALRQLVDEEAARAGWLEVEWVCNLGEERFDRDLETTIYRVVQEALTNARKHAKTQRIKVALLGEGNDRPCLKLEVQDWGQGFIPEEKWAKLDA